MESVIKIMDMNAQIFYHFLLIKSPMIFFLSYRKIALTVILTRAGLGLDPIKLKKLSWAVLRLAFTPCVCEAITVGIVSHFLLGFPWKWSLMLG